MFRAKRSWPFRRRSPSLNSLSSTFSKETLLPHFVELISSSVDGNIRAQSIVSDTQARRGCLKILSEVHMQDKTKVLITGAGGFIGHHLTKYLTERGYWVRGVDIKEPEFGATTADEFKLLDLRQSESLRARRKTVGHVYGLAANMGGIGFIENNKAVIVRDNTFINLHTIEAPR